MAIKKIEGIVVGETLYSESSKILKVFTKEYGLVSLLSKGCRKLKSPLREASSPLIYGVFDISYKEKGISTLMGIHELRLFRHILLDYKSLSEKMFAFEIANLTVQVLSQKQISREEEMEIYDIFLATLQKIEEGLSPSVLYDIVRLKYLEYLGVKPSIDGCAVCGSGEDIVTMDASSFGFVCRSCYERQKLVSKESLRLIRMFYYVDISRIKQLEVGEEIKEVEDFLEEYYDRHTGIYLKTKEKMKLMAKLEGTISS